MVNHILALLVLATPPSCSPAVRPRYVAAPDYAQSVQLADVQASGVINVVFTVAKSGDVAEAQITDAKPNPFLTEPTLSAVKQWKFDTAGQPMVPCTAKATFKFTLVPFDAPTSTLGTRYEAPWNVEVRARRPR